MKTLSIADFKNLIAHNSWHRIQEHDVVERMACEVETWNDNSESLELLVNQHVWGSISVTSTLDDITITYTEGFEFDECDPDSLTTQTDGDCGPWSIEGITVVDDNGMELDINELVEYLPDEFCDIDHSTLEIEQVIDIDTDEDNPMETFTLEINNAPDIRFTGELVAHAESSDDKAMGSSYSGDTGRWTELFLYKTRGGKFICHQIGHTRWTGERTRYSGKVCETLEEVKEFFGHRWLAKELYDKAGIDNAVDIE